MTTADTSVLIAAFSSWHESHRQSLRALATTSAVIGHVAVETYSVLTRLPRTQRARSADVWTFLTESLPGRWIGVDEPSYRTVLASATTTGTRGGAVYDALIASAARDAGLRLVTLDRRATRTYAAVGVEHTLLT